MSAPIVEPADATRDCLLFRMLQVFLADRLNLGQPAAHAAARTFMTDYHLADVLPLAAHEVPKEQPKDARSP